ncbi:MAG: acyl-CoA dehydrogenase family protein [Anaerolineaceae bacterium]|nr:acyl-CoA dehydrogenase family protein [Anaerolineaceae bacterium]
MDSAEDSALLQLTDEQRMLRATVRDFAQREIAPHAAHLDETGAFPADTVRRMGAMGLMGIEVPERYGGAGMDALACALTIQELARVDASHSTIVSVNNSLYCGAILAFGNEEQKCEFLAPVASGRQTGAYSLSEPSSGSDAGAMACRADLNGDGSHWLINGRKSWVTNGPVAERLVLFAVTDPSAGNRGITAFLIDAAQPGLTRGRVEPKLGIRASVTCELHFDNFACPVANVLGEAGAGFRIALSVLDAGRIGIAAQALGIAEAAFAASVDWARQREAFGGPIARFQLIQQKVADMKLRIEASRLLLYDAVAAKQRSRQTGERYTLQAGMAKLHASETAAYVTDEALQIHGGMGYSRELPLERYWRDARITRIYEGSSEIQRLVIARNVLGVR